MIEDKLDRDYSVFPCNKSIGEIYKNLLGGIKTLGAVRECLKVWGQYFVCLPYRS